MSSYRDEITKRRTFAIISHPDAGKTTLTEKLLLYGGAINLAGSVKGKRTAKHAVSDWMEIEKQRGISVTSSVLQFKYDGYCINILDTPGHEDFSEDTYRTLMAADSAVMVIDGSKGVEKQTIKLFKVCVMRNIPIITFINKMDRDAKNPFDLLEDIENVLGINTYPVNWPIGSGKEFKGVYDRNTEKILCFTANNGQKEVEKTELALDDPAIDDTLGQYLKADLFDEIELLDGAGDEFNLEAVRDGKPFVFKIQANMNKAHRDRIAFMRICSGKFEKNMEVFHVQGNKKMRLSQPQQIMAQEREIVEEAYAGDIIGVFDPGIFSIGDTICSANHKVQFKGIPTFAPEHFMRVRQKDTMKRKQFIKGTSQIAQEGAIQIFQELDAGMEEVIVGVVGVLQFDVLKYRLENEYNVDIIMESLPYEYIRWIVNDDIDPKTLDLASDTKRIQDLKGNRLLLFTSYWSIDWALDHNKGLELREFGTN